MMAFGGKHIISAFLIIGSTAMGADSFSVTEWKKSFSAAVAKNDSKQIDQLKNFSILESKAVPACVDCSSKKTLQEARIFFDQGQYEKAEELYNKIPKNAAQWLEAVEERGWTHFQRQDFEKSLAQAKTLLSPQFVEIVSSESFFLQSLSQLRICNYEGVLDTHTLFKEKYKTRLVELQNLAKSGESKALDEALAKVDKFPLKFEDFGDKLKVLPLLVYRDLEFQKNVLKLKVSTAALEVLADGKNSSLNAYFSKIKNESRKKLNARVQSLASLETERNSKIIKKLNLVEIEAIQRIHTDMKLSDDMYHKGEFKKTNADQLIFMDDGRPWIDELDKYDVAAKSCAQNIRRKM